MDGSHVLQMYFPGSYPSLCDTNYSWQLNVQGHRTILNYIDTGKPLPVLISTYKKTNTHDIGCILIRGLLFGHQIVDMAVEMICKKNLD